MFCIHRAAAAQTYLKAGMDDFKQLPSNPREQRILTAMLSAAFGAGMTPQEFLQLQASKKETIGKIPASLAAMCPGVDRWLKRKARQPWQLPSQPSVWDRVMNIIITPGMETRTNAEIMAVMNPLITELLQNGFIADLSLLPDADPDAEAKKFALMEILRIFNEMADRLPIDTIMRTVEHATENAARNLQHMTVGAQHIRSAA
jgi:hypothetical protein